MKKKITIALTSCAITLKLTTAAPEVTASGAPPATLDIAANLAFVFFPEGLERAAQSAACERRAISLICKELQLRCFPRAFGKLDLPGSVQPIIQGDSDGLTPVVLLPDPSQLNSWLKGRVSDSRQGVFGSWVGDSPRASPRGALSGETIHFKRVPDDGKSRVVVAVPWGVASETIVPSSSILQAGRYTTRPAVEEAMEQFGLARREVGIVRTFPATDRVWGYCAFPGNVSSGVTPSPACGVAFAIAEANSLGRDDQDALRDTRPTPQTNHVTCSLVPPLWPTSVAPYIMPRPTQPPIHDRGPRPEAIVLTDAMLRAADGAIVCRAGPTWSQAAPDLEFDAELGNKDRILAVFIDQRVTAARLVTILLQLGGAGNQEVAEPCGAASTPSVLAKLAERAQALREQVGVISGKPSADGL